MSTPRRVGSSSRLGRQRRPNQSIVIFRRLPRRDPRPARCPDPASHISNLDEPPCSPTRAGPGSHVTAHRRLRRQGGVPWIYAKVPELRHLQTRPGSPSDRSRTPVSTTACRAVFPAGTAGAQTRSYFGYQASRGTTSVTSWTSICRRWWTLCSWKTTKASGQREEVSHLLQLPLPLQRLRRAPVLLRWHRRLRPRKNRHRRRLQMMMSRRRHRRRNHRNCRR